MTWKTSLNDSWIACVVDYEEGHTLKFWKLQFWWAWEILAALLLLSSLKLWVEVFFKQTKIPCWKSSLKIHFSCWWILLSCKFLMTLKMVLKPQKGEIFQATACLIKATYFTSSAKCQFLSLQLLFVMFIH